LIRKIGAIVSALLPACSAAYQYKVNMVRNMRWVLSIMLLFFGGLPAWALAAPLSAARVLVHGDSLSAGYGLELGQEWPALLERQLQKSAFAGVQVANSSISGETTAGGLARLPAVLAKERPSMVILALGANDALQGQDLTQTQANLQAMVDLAQKAQAKVLILASDIPPNYGARYHAQFQQVFTDVAAQNRLGIVHFSVQEFAKKPAYLQKDALHPTALAQPVIAARVWVGLQPLLGKKNSQKQKKP
jgi:acyl-CoA thioesterase-1